MIWTHFLSGQFRKPSGMLGRLLLGSYLDRANVRINRLVYDALAHKPDSHLLEIGFGGGDLLFRIAADLDNGCIEGVDLSPEMVAGACKRARRLGVEAITDFHLGSVETLPFAAASFDRACSVHTIYFWPDLQRGLAELGRVVKPGGRLVLGFSGESELRQDGWVERGFKAYTNEQIADAYTTHGFVPDRLEKIERQGRGSVYAFSGIRS